MKKTLTILLTWCITIYNAQTACSWSITTPGFFDSSGGSGGMLNWENYDKSSGVDANGNLYITVKFFSPINVGGTTLDPTTGTIALIKYDANGNIIWAKNFGTSTASDSHVHSICVDASGNSYLTGEWNGNNSPSIQFGSATITNNNDGLDMFIVKINSSGNTVWAKNSDNIIGCGTGTAFTGGKGIVGNSASTDAAGNVYVAGNFLSQHITFGNTVLTNDSTITSGNIYDCGNAVTSDAFITKLDQNGNFIWSTSIKGKNADLAKSIVTNSIGESFVLGQSDSKTVSVGGISLVNSLYQTANRSHFYFIVKYGSSGSVLWARKLEYTANCGAIAINNNNDVILGGDCTGPYLKFNGTNVLQSSASPSFLLKLNASGSFVWAKTNTGNARRLSTDQSNNIYLTGNFVGKYDNNGSLKWTTNNPNSANSYAINVDPSKNVYISGSGFLAKIDTFIVNVTAGGNTTFCQGDSVILSSPLNPSYLWNTGVTTQHITVKQSGNYYLINSCGNIYSNSIGVVVNQYPIGSASNQIIGSGDKTNIVLNSTTGGTSYAFTAGLDSGSVSGFSNGSTTASKISQTLIGDGAITYTIIPASSGCTGDPFSVRAIVSTAIPVGWASPQTIWSGTQSSVTFTSSIPGTTYAWTASLYSGATTGFSNCSNSCGSSIIQTLTNAGTVKYTVTPIGPSPDFIAGNTFTVAVNVKVVSPTKVRLADCGITLNPLNQLIYCDAVSGATDYEWEYTTGGVTETKLSGATGNNFNPLWFTGIEYGKTYDIRVRAKIGTQFGSFGSVCQITTPATIPLTQVRILDCGNTLTTLSQLIYCDAVIGASDYEWQYTVAGVTKTKLRGAASNNFNPLWFVGVEYGKTYDIKVRAKVGTQWGSFASICQITTPATIPLTQVRILDCGTTLATLSQLIYCDAVIGASDYEWEYTIAGVTRTKLRGVTSNNFNPTWFIGVDYGKTYDVRVRAKVGTQWGSFSSICQIITPALALVINQNENSSAKMIRNLADDENTLTQAISIYPNPASETLKVNFLTTPEEEITITLENMLGQIVYNITTSQNQNDINVSFLENGIYYVRVKTKTSSSTSKIIVE